MPRFFSVVFSLLLVLMNVAPVFAATASSTVQKAAPPIPSVPPSQPTGPLKCFDYYTFGSVQADLQPTVATTVPGATMTFVGDIVSSNPYPLLEGTLYVKIFKRDKATFATGDGNDVVDQFVIKDGITLPAKGKLAVKYEWKVPLNAEGGDYYAAYFFTTSKRYNLMGLSFTDDVVGNQAQFTIKGDTTIAPIATLSKIDTKLNDRDHHFAAFPLHFAAGDTVTAKTTITNPSDKPKMMPLQWTQYAWDAMNKDNLRFTKTELVSLKPKETKTVSYEVQPQRESVVYVTGVTQDYEAKSILDIRYVRDGIEETRINFPGLTAFPLAKDDEQTLFACAHSINLPLVPGNTLTLTLTDRDGKTIHQYNYEGDISGSMSGFGDKFKPEKNINYAMLTATLKRNGVTVEEVKTIYDCKQIDPSSCLPEEKNIASSWFSYFKVHFLVIILTIVIVLLIAAIAVFLYKKRKYHIDSDGSSPMTSPMA